MPPRTDGDQVPEARLGLVSGWATTQDQSREPQPKIQYPATARPWAQVVTGVDAQGRAVGNNVVRERQSLSARRADQRLDDRVRHRAAELGHLADLLPGNIGAAQGLFHLNASVATSLCRHPWPSP
jgi:hypothetical protein